MNKVMLIGRIVKEPAIFGEGTALVARYTLAVNGMGRTSEITNFIPCVAFGRNAEIAEKYFKKGLKVAVTGSVGNNNYTNRSGKKVYQMLVIAEMQEFDLPKIFSPMSDVSPFENNETNQETTEELKEKEHYETGDSCKVIVEAIDKAIQSLENQSSVIEELEKIRSEIELTDFDFGDYYDHTDTIIEMVSKVIDKRIAELKGENK